MSEATLTATQPPPQAVLPRVAVVVAIAVAVAAFYVSGARDYFHWDHVQSNLAAWQAWVGDNLILAVAVYFSVYVVATALSLPVAAILTLLAGALFGRWLGTGVVSLASTAGATLAFLLSRYLLQDFVQSRFADRLARINAGIDRDGSTYLLTLRLVPLFPFFVVNACMGLTRIPLGTYVVVSWLGMLLSTFLYVNAGTELGRLQSPADALSPKVLGSLALLGLMPVVVRQLLKLNVTKKQVLLAAIALVLVAVVGAVVRTVTRYHTSDVMAVPMTEYNDGEYPDDPAERSLDHGKYTNRRLTLTKRDATHFDLHFTSPEPHVAGVRFTNIDVSLMTPSTPEWTRGDAGLTRIALTDREWNRQQVAFPRDTSPQLEVTGGDGFETRELVSAELAKNCLNAGLWELLLYKRENGKKALYYQGWFRFPLGHYKDIVEANTGLDYRKHWYYLEHWFDPTGTPMAMNRLRTVQSESEVPARYDPDAPTIAWGEQARKRRTTAAPNVRTWGHFGDGHRVRFASFVPPGYYQNDTPWANEYHRMQSFGRAVVRTVKSPATDKPLHEVELVFSSPGQPGVCRFVVSGVDLTALPQLPAERYAEGLYMPMGIGVPPFFENYADLVKSPPETRPYFSLLLDGDDNWLDHHSFAIDGPVMHRDPARPGLVHVYLLSYERHTLVRHVTLDLDDFLRSGS